MSAHPIFEHMFASMGSLGLLPPAPGPTLLFGADHGGTLRMTAERVNGHIVLKLSAGATVVMATINGAENTALMRELAMAGGLIEAPEPPPTSCFSPASEASIRARAREASPIPFLSSRTGQEL